MIKREFSPKEKVVLMAIYEQSKQYPDGPFKYNVGEGQLYINNTSVALGRSEHLEIIRSFTFDRIIDAELARTADGELMIRITQTKKTGGKPLCHNGVRKLLRNPFYAGKFRWGSVIYSGNHPPYDFRIAI